MNYKSSVGQRARTRRKLGRTICSNCKDRIPPNKVSPLRKYCPTCSDIRNKEHQRRNRDGKRTTHRSR